MFAALRSGLVTKLPFVTAGKELCKVAPKNKFQVATFKRAADRNPDDLPLVKPFPYHEKEYTVFTMLCDRNGNGRVHDDTKMIVVEGLPASGKNKVAKELAKEFDFLYLPQPTFDDLYVTHWGFDVRSLDPKLPENARSWDIERWLHNPSHRSTISMQMYMYLLRQKRWMSCLSHLLATGQGVVTVRSPWSDSIFAKAMYESRYISREAFEYHTEAFEASIWAHMQPHIIVYLDVPVSTVQENIKKRGLAHEKNNKAITDKFLTDLKNSYHDYLVESTAFSFILVYDWTHDTDVEYIVSDMEALDFEKIPYRMFPDWRALYYGEEKVRLKHYTYDADKILMLMDIYKPDVPEMLLTAEEWKAFNEVWNEIPDSKYDVGYNIYKGDKNLLWKHNFVIDENRIAPLLDKYYQRKQKLISGKSS